MLAVPPKFACKSWISQLYELIARWQRKRLSAPGDQNMHRLQLFSTPWKLCSVVNTNTCREKKENVNGAYDCVEIEGSLYVITHITGFRLGQKWNRTTMGDNTVTGVVTIAVLSQDIAMAYQGTLCSVSRRESRCMLWRSLINNKNTSEKSRIIVLILLTLLVCHLLAPRGGHGWK